MANVVFQLIVFNGDYVLEAVLKSLLPFGKVIVTEGPVEFWHQRGYQTSTDATNDILHSLLPADDILHGQFAEKDEMMNAGIARIPSDATHLWMVDADEIWDALTLRAVIAELDDWDAVSFKPRTFYGGFDHLLGGFEERFEWMRIQRWHNGAEWETHRPPTILAPDGKPYRSKRHLYSEFTAARDWRFYHYSYVFPSQVNAKAQYYATRGACIPNYFDRVYKPWVLGDSYARRMIEHEYDGVHEWLPTRRGDARTYPFAGQHPENIKIVLPELKRRFAREVTEMREENA